MTQIAAGRPAIQPAAEEPRSTHSSVRRRSLTAYGLLAPSLFGVIVFLGIPVILVVVFSFLKWNLLTAPTFVGLTNYLDVFQHEGAGHALLVTFYYFLLNIPVQTALALGMALLMNRRGRFTALIRVLCVLPYLATPVAMGVVWQWIFAPQTGVVNTLLHFVGVSGPDWLNSPGWSMPVVAFANIWQFVGYNMLFFLAGLQAIPPMLYEASAIDGASTVQRFFRVTLPLLRPTMLFVLVTGAIGSFQVFDSVYVMTNGGPGTSTTVMNMLIYQNGFIGFRIGAASALSVILFAVILVVTLIQFRYFNRRTVYELV
ncbi:putative sugar ABC transporter, permease protein [Frondihabitans sucicola]|uniref:Sugar ABC transporter, permease protein n=1 Tax=Frondihabitans sucicola TaxID=1268041 RepID=A0ABM8GMD2_9MICO|nr:sugar ABC transporter permease [Frondihabitans sucicola]BDZ49562.1 putative sugar ABC transporter, permease protein [Frondihabitans sucicola]